MTEKIDYKAPAIRVMTADSSDLLEGSPDMPFNPREGTGDALSRESSFDDAEQMPAARSVWDD